MEDMALILMGAFFAGGLFAFGLIRLFIFCESLQEKENLEQEEKILQEEGVGFHF